jgi:hypothetical protein
MSSITKTITITYGSTSRLKEIKVDPKCSWHTCQLWFNKNMKKVFLAGKYGDHLRITWHDGHHQDFKIKRSKN